MEPTFPLQSCNNPYQSCGERKMHVSFFDVHMTVPEMWPSSGGSGGGYGIVLRHQINGHLSLSLSLYLSLSLSISISLSLSLSLCASPEQMPHAVPSR